MKKLLFISLAFLIFSFLTSCSKDEPKFASVEGYVREWKSNKPIPNAMIRIQECSGEVLGSFSCNDFDTIYSDANGYYKYYKELIGDEALGGGASGYYLVVSKEKYSTYQVENYNMPSRGTRTKDMVLLPSAWLKLHVKAVNQYTDELIELGGLYAGEPLPGNGFKAAKGTDYIKYYKKGGNDTITFRWSILKSGIIKDNIEKVYLPALDTTEFRLFF